MIDGPAIRRLAAMDIQVWRTRPPPPDNAAAARRADAEPAGDRADEAPESGIRPRPGRIRLEAGSGRWLLVVDDADRARHAPLIEDIRATLGAHECRFGTWSDSAEAGLAADDWAGHGIDHALVFGGEPDDVERRDARPALIRAAELAVLATSGKARRALWRQLAPLLED